MNDEEAKKKILARRAAFVAAAIAGVSGIACDSHPFTCLEPPLATTGPSTSASATPQPYLSEAIVPVAVDAGATIDASLDATSTPSADAGAKDASLPRPCLSATAPRSDGGIPPMPRVCLSPVR